MRFYRVSFYETEDGQRGFRWFKSRREAWMCSREWARATSGDEGARADIEEISIAPSQTGILDALNAYADHPNNG